MSTAPNYDGEFPGAGEKIGPLWQKLWDAMDDGRWYKGSSLSEVFSNGVAESTVRGVLARGAAKGAIERKPPVDQQSSKRVPAFFRRTDADVKKPDAQ